METPTLALGLEGIKCADYEVWWVLFAPYLDPTVGQWAPRGPLVVH